MNEKHHGKHYTGLLLLLLISSTAHTRRVSAAVETRVKTDECIHFTVGEGLQHWTSRVYAVTAADLRPLNPDNTLIKFADDTYLVIPSANVSTRTAEIDRIGAWATQNNLKQSKEVLFCDSTTTGYSTESTLTHSMFCIVFCHHLLLLPRTIICDPEGTIDSYLIMLGQDWCYRPWVECGSVDVQTVTLIPNHILNPTNTKHLQICPSYFTHIWSSDALHSDMLYHKISYIHIKRTRVVTE